MSDDPDSPEYDWLYDGKPSPEPEKTQVLGRMEHPQAPIPATPPPPPPAPRRSKIAPEPGVAKRRRRIPYVKIALLLLVAWIAFLVAVPLIAWQKIVEVDAMPSGARPANLGGTTYLLVGSDSRKGLSKAENRRLGTGGVGNIGERTDTIMLLHTGSGPSVLLSIPRDSLVPIPGHGITKINAAFAYGGPKLLIKTIEQDTGVRIDHYVEIGFGGFVNAVDAVGGVTICPTTRMVDPQANLRIKKGCQQVDGVTALGYARSRHTSAIGDIDRARHQREVVAAIGKKVKSLWTILLPWRYSGIINAGVSSLKVSKGTSVFDLAHFALAMSRVNGKDGLTCSMPISDLAVHWDRPRALALLDLIRTDRTADIPKRLCESTGLTS